VKPHRPEESPDLIISARDFLWFVDQTLTEMVTIVRALGDQMANKRPNLTGANSPYAILTHSLGVMEYWGGCVVAGRSVERDRDAEFRAEGRVAELLPRVSAARRQLEDDLSSLDPLAAPRHDTEAVDADLPLGTTQAGALFHILEELAQHLGQMQISRDILLQGNRAR
jgi:hypothetical protein